MTEIKTGQLWRAKDNECVYRVELIDHRYRLKNVRLEMHEVSGLIKGECMTEGLAHAKASVRYESFAWFRNDAELVVVQ